MAKATFATMRGDGSEFRGTSQFGDIPTNESKEFQVRSSHHTHSNVSKAEVDSSLTVDIKDYQKMRAQNPGYIASYHAKGD